MGVHGTVSGKSGDWRTADRRDATAKSHLRRPKCRCVISSIMRWRCGSPPSCSLGPRFHRDLHGDRRQPIPVSWRERRRHHDRAIWRSRRRSFSPHLRSLCGCSVHQVSQRSRATPACSSCWHVRDRRSWPRRSTGTPAGWHLDRERSNAQAPTLGNVVRRRVVVVAELSTLTLITPGAAFFLPRSLDFLPSLDAVRRVHCLQT